MGEGAFRAQGTTCSNDRQARTSKKCLETVEMSNLLSQAFKDAPGSTPLYLLEASRPSLALKASSPLQHCTLPGAALL